MFLSIKPGAKRTEIDKNWNFEESEAEIKGIGHGFALSENIKRQSLYS